MSGVCLAYSADGIHWREEPTNPVIQGHYDNVSTPVWDPLTGHWLCYTRPTVHASGFLNRERVAMDVDGRTASDGTTAATWPWR